MDYPGYAGTTDMFSKQTQSNQPNSVDAREAVKKQLLRSLMQQVVDEVSNLDETAFNDMVKSMVADIDTSSLRARVESQIETKFEESLKDLDLEARIGETEEKLSSSVQDLLDERVGSIASDVVKVRLADLNLHVIRQDIESHARQVLEEKLSTIDVDDIVEVNKEALLADIETSLLKKTADISEGIVNDFHSDLSNQFSRIAENIEKQTSDSSSELISSFKSDYSKVLKSAASKATETVSSEIENQVTEAKEQWEEKLNLKLDADLGRARKDVVSRLEKAIKKDATSLQTEITQFVSDEFKKKFDSVNIASSVSEQKAKLLEFVATDLNARVRLEADSIVEGQIAAFDIAAVQNELDQRVNNLVNEKVQAINFDDIVESNKVKIVTQVDESLQVKAEAVSNDLIKSIKSSFSKKLAAVSKSESIELTQKLSQLVEEALINDAPALGLIVENASNAIIQDKKWIDVATKRVTDLLSLQLGSSVKSNIDQSSETIADAVEYVHADAELVNTLVHRVKDHVIKQIASLTLEQFSDVEQTSKVASDHFEYGHDSLISAISMLRTNVLQDIAKRTLVSFGDAESIQKDARKWVNEEDSFIQLAVAEIVKTAHQVISVLVHQQMSNTELVVRKIAPEFTADTIQIRNAVKATGQELISRITDLVKTELSDTEKVASDSASQIEDNHEGVQKAVRLTVSKMIDEIISLTETRLYCTDRISEEARGRMPKDIPTVVQAADVLENMLLSEVATYATKRLYEVGSASEKASAFLKADKEIEAVRKALTNNILEAIASSSTTDIADTNAVAKRAFYKVDMETEAIIKAIDHVRDQLVTEIAESATTRIADVAEVAKESRALIPSTNSSITGATNRVYDMLVQEVADNTLAIVSESDKTAEIVLSRVQQEAEVMGRVQEIVHNQMIERLLAHALQEIKDKVSDGSHEAEKEFFKSSLKVFAEPETTKNASPDVNMSTKTAQDSNSVPSSNEISETEEMVVATPVPDGPASVEKEPSRDSVDWTLLSDIQESPAEEMHTKPLSQDQTAAEETVVNDSTEPNSSPSPKPWSVSEFTVSEPSLGKVPAGDGSKGQTPRMAETKKNQAEPTFYMYGIVSTNQVVESMFAGIEGLQERSVVYSLPCGNLTAIVSKLTDPAFSPYMIRKSMRDNAWLKDQVRHHAGVLSEAKGLMTIIPLRFGTVFNSENGIRRFVETQRSKMMDTLSRLQDKSEFGIRVVCDAERVLSVTEFKGIINQQKNSFDGRSPLEAIAASVARRIHGPLNEMASEAVSKGVPAIQAAENLVVALNSTYLVPVVGEKNFRARVTTLAQEMRSFGVAIEVSGPWPPYHFVDVDMGGSEEYFMSEIPA